MKHPMEAHISAAISCELRDWLIEQAEREFFTVSQLIRKAIKIYRRGIEADENFADKPRHQ